jgi:hypothetical protein
MTQVKKIIPGFYFFGQNLSNSSRVFIVKVNFHQDKKLYKILYCELNNLKLQTCQFFHPENYFHTLL